MECSVRHTNKTPALWLTVAVSLILCPALLSAHLKLTRSAPAAGSTLTSPPARLQLWFSQEPLLPLSGITLTGPRGAVKLGRLAAAGERSLVVSIEARLEPGAYRIAWKTAGDDGHVLQGTVDFSVKAATEPPK
jgi:methionine-rich copper-binding protein CopC